MQTYTIRGAVNVTGNTFGFLVPVFVGDHDNKYYIQQVEDTDDVIQGMLQIDFDQAMDKNDNGALQISVGSEPVYCFMDLEGKIATDFKGKIKDVIYVDEFYEEPEIMLQIGTLFDEDDITSRSLQKICAALSKKEASLFLDYSVRPQLLWKKMLQACNNPEIRETIRANERKIMSVFSSGPQKTHENKELNEICESIGIKLFDLIQIMMKIVEPARGRSASNIYERLRDEGNTIVDELKDLTKTYKEKDYEYRRHRASFNSVGKAFGFPPPGTPQYEARERAAKMAQEQMRFAETVLVPELRELERRIEILKREYQRNREEFNAVDGLPSPSVKDWSFLER